MVPGLCLAFAWCGALPSLHVLSEARGAAAHDFALADELGVELAAVEGEVDVEVDAVEGALRRVHALEIFFEIFAREVRGEGDDFLDACLRHRMVSLPLH